MSRESFIRRESKKSPVKLQDECGDNGGDSAETKKGGEERGIGKTGRKDRKGMRDKCVLNQPTVTQRKGRPGVLTACRA